jgi:two-component system alkaline phosphatase synthesis response regulator PhoP
MDKRKRVLLVDDEAMVRQVAARALYSDYEVFVLPSGQSFDETLEDIQPDLVILDINMPFLSGIQLCQRLRANPRYRTLPVLFITGLGQDDAKSATQSAGGDYFLPKPFHLEDLHQAVDQLMHR